MSLIPRRKFSLDVVCCWLQLGRIDIQQGEGLGLDWGWGSNQGKAVSLVESGGRRVEGAGGEIAQQAVEAVDRVAIGGEFAGALAQRRRRGLRGGDDRGAFASGGGGIVVIEQHGLRHSRMCHSTWQAS